jgi:hypothetical protein
MSYGEKVISSRRSAVTILRFPFRVSPFTGPRPRATNYPFIAFITSDTANILMENKLQGIKKSIAVSPNIKEQGCCAIYIDAERAGPLLTPPFE